MSGTNWNGTYKVLLGPCLVTIENLCFGYFFGNIKIKKQVTNASYPSIFRELTKNGIYNGLYGGYLRYGFPQTFKSIPLLATQNIVNRYPITDNKKQQETFAGFCGGFSQALLITPLQRGRTLYLRDNSFSSMNVSSLFKGFSVTALRRSTEWGARLYFKNIAETAIIEHKKSKDFSATSISPNSAKLSTKEKLFCGFFAGTSSIFTNPIDVSVSIVQNNKTKQNAIQILKNKIAQNGISMFSRGMTIKVFYGCWHSLFVIGLGNIAFEYIDKSK